MAHVERWILVGTLIFCLVGLISYFSYLQVAKPTIPTPTMPTIDIPKPPSQAEVPPPVPEKEEEQETPEPASLAIQKLHVEWEASGPKEAEYLWGVAVDDDEGNIVYAAGALPETPLGKLDVWKSTDGAESWEFLGRFDELEENFRHKEEMWDDYQNCRITVFEEESAHNNPDIILKSEWLGPDDWRFLLSFNNGNSWYEINLPPSVTVEGTQALTDKNRFELISYDGEVKLFITYHEVWRTTIKPP
jgi:hypothetical protein